MNRRNAIEAYLKGLGSITWNGMSIKNDEDRNAAIDWLLSVERAVDQIQSPERSNKEFAGMDNWIESNGRHHYEQLNIPPSTQWDFPSRPVSNGEA